MKSGLRESFDRKSKKYRTKYLDELKKLYGEAKSDIKIDSNASNSSQETRSIKSDPYLAGNN